MLLLREMVVGSGPGADESGNEERGAHGVHQAESDGLKEAVSVVEGAEWGAVEAPFLAAKLIEFLVSHKKGPRASAVGPQLSA